ncbi:MAG: glycerophosphodiester phosphodiesterase family protein [Desulfobacterales bacterium]
MRHFEPVCKPLIIGHRGCRARFPENTITAFQAAIEAGADMIEFDVRLCADGHPVVIHDRTLDRTTTGSGNVADRRLFELKQLDAGSWFHNRFRHETVPTLEEVLDRFGQNTLMNIEVKVDSDQPRRESAQIGDKIMLSLTRKNLLSRVIISSFDKTLLECIEARGRSPAIGVLTKLGEESDPVFVCRALKAFSYHPNYLEVDQQLVTMMHSCGIGVVPYTVNDPEDIRRLIRMGVDGLITDDPETAAGIRKTGAL